MTRRPARTGPVKTGEYVVLGIVIGFLAGIAEALIAAIGDPDYWGRVAMCWSQLGFGTWALGAAGGWVVAKRVQRRRAERREKG